MTETDPRPDRERLTWREGDMPYSEAFGDHFYCQTDGRLECGHVFLSGNHLPERWQGVAQFEIGELGFGTALNFCETLRQWRLNRAPGQHLTFTSFELFPMSRSDIDRALSHWSALDAERSALTALWPDDRKGVIDLEIDAQTRLRVVCGDAFSGVTAETRQMQAWFLDGFAPSRNGAMWSEELMRAVFDHTAQGGRFATYAAAGFVRRNLLAAGFQVEKRKGFAGKREMLCGQKP